MRKVTARVLTLALLVVTVLVIPGIARADGTVTWDGKKGANNLPCGSDVHWVLTGSDVNLITSATLTVDGAQPIDMTQNGNGSWSATSDQPISDASTSVTVDFVGTANPDNLSLQLSDCKAPEVTTTTTTTLGNAPGTPNTGFNPLPYVALGLILLAGGAVVLRRKTA